MNNEINELNAFHHPFEICETIGNLKILISYNDLRRETVLEKWVSQWHIHSECEMVAVIQGEESVVADTTLDVNAGDVLLVPRHLEHQCIPKGGEQIKVSLLVGVGIRKNDAKLSATDVKIFRIVNEFLNNLHSPIVLPQRDDLVAYVIDAVNMACSQSLIGHSIFKYQLINFVMRTFEALDEKYNSELSNEKNDKKDIWDETDIIRSQIIERYIYWTPYNKLSIKGLSEYIHLSERQISRIFLEHFGATFKQVVNQRRIKNAQSLLDNGIAISVVADTVGFTSINGFNKAFKSVVGVTPYQYAKELENGERVPGNGDDTVNWELDLRKEKEEKKS